MDMIKKIFESENASLPMIIGRTVLTRFFALYPSVKTPQKFMDDYTAHFALRGQTVKLLKDGRSTRVKVLGVESKDGALMVENRKREMTRVTTRGSVILPKRIRLPRDEMKKNSSK
jgi:hypothetical protein